MRAIFVDVMTKWTKDGQIIPISIYWPLDPESGAEEEYLIDKILSGPTPRFSKAGGTGKQYVVMIKGHRRVLFLQKDKWFVESEK